MQEMHAIPKPSALPVRPVFPIAGHARTPREEPLASPVGWDGTNHLTNAQAITLRREQKKIQRELKNVAIETADRKVSKAMQASRTGPKLMYRNELRAVHVKPGDSWHSIHRSRVMKRCDYTAFCSKCGSASSGNHTQGLHDPYTPHKVLTKYVKDTLDRTLL